MYLSQLKIKHFRRLKEINFNFVPGLNIVLGANNIGKTALVDALRALLAGHEDPYPRFYTDDIHQPDNGDPTADEIRFEFIFSALSLDDEATFLEALIPNSNGDMEVHLGVSYNRLENSDWLKPKRWCGNFEEISLNGEMLENLRSVYLPPLRDASKGLKPGRNSQLARLLRLIGDKDQAGKEDIENTLQKYDDELKNKGPIKDTSDAITDRHTVMLGDKLAQTLELGISGTDFHRLSSRLTLIADNRDIEQNGLGFNNLIYMSVVLSEMIKDPSAAYRSLIVEEPEAHLHPQLQSVLLDYLESVENKEQGNSVQVFVTSHSPNFASIANINSTTCLSDDSGNVCSFSPREAIFDKNEKKHQSKRQKLERYLDATRAELFFARKIIFVEGAAELMMINVLAKTLGDKYNLRKNAVSVISVDGLNFDSFVPLFGENGIKIPVAIITDADPADISNEDDSDEKGSQYPDKEEVIKVSDNTEKLKTLEDQYLKVFHGQKTFEYDMALYEKNRPLMLTALEEMHPKIAKALAKEVEVVKDNAEQAKTLFKGMFEREGSKKNVQKGAYGQNLAQVISTTDKEIELPGYILEAIKHVCE